MGHMLLHCVFACSYVNMVSGSSACFFVAKLSPLVAYIFLCNSFFFSFLYICYAFLHPYGSEGPLLLWDILLIWHESKCKNWLLYYFFFPLTSTTFLIFSYLAFEVGMPKNLNFFLYAGKNRLKKSIGVDQKYGNVVPPTFGSRSLDHGRPQKEVKYVCTPVYIYIYIHIYMYICADTRIHVHWML